MFFEYFNETGMQSIASSNFVVEFTDDVRVRTNSLVVIFEK